MNSSSIYDAALSQLHVNYQQLQESMVTLARDQNRILESVARIENDLESYKDSQNDRLDEILTNIDSDIRKVSQDALKASSVCENKLSELMKASVPQKQVESLKSDIQELRNELEEQLATTSD